MTWTWVWRLYTLGILFRVSAQSRGPKITSAIGTSVALDVATSLILQVTAAAIAVVLLSRMISPDEERQA